MIKCRCAQQRWSFQNGAATFVKISREEKAKTSGQKVVTFTTGLGLLTEKREAIPAKLYNSDEAFAKQELFQSS